MAKAVNSSVSDGTPAEISKQLRATGEIEELDKLMKCARLQKNKNQQLLDKRDQTQTSLKPLKSLQVAALTEQVVALITTSQ